MSTKETLIFVLLFPLQVFSWGGLGHSTVGAVAQQNLTPKAQSAVKKILGTETLADVATWADDVRADKEYRQTVWYHFEKISDGLSYLENLKAIPEWQQKKGGSVMAILRAYAVLTNPKASDQERYDTLKFLVHFVGDIHQPLHSGRPDDHGGSKIITSWFGEESSLHHIWDTLMISTGHRDIFHPKVPLANNADVYAKYLAKQFSQNQISTELDVESWLNESMALRTAAYEKTYETDPAKYQSQHLQEIDLRLYVAGLRLASFLNSAFAGEPLPPKELKLWKDIESVVGPLDNVISFKP